MWHQWKHDVRLTLGLLCFVLLKPVIAWAATGHGDSTQVQGYYHHRDPSRQNSFLISQRCSRSWQLSASEKYQSVDSLDDFACTEQSERFVLPIFPLRKSVKLPTEALTLNLYEERYLALAEYVLSGTDDCESGNQQPTGRNKSSDGHDRPILFGALYCSNKPQMVKNGVEPSVPMVEVGDVGTVFSVTHHEENNVPVTRSDVNGETRRRIKMKGLGVGRFRIERVLHNGYGGGDTKEDESSGAVQLPFILVEASRVDDAMPGIGSKEEKEIRDLETKLYNFIMTGGDSPAYYEGTANMQSAGGGDEEEDDTSLATKRLELLLPLELRSAVQDGAAQGTSPVAHTLEQAMYLWDSSDNYNMDECEAESQRQQLLSFALTSSLVCDESASEMLKLLQLTSTKERLSFVQNSIQQGQGWVPRIDLRWKWPQ
jgi:Lon protease-like protein